jgi:hypothetical protein
MTTFARKRTTTSIAQCGGVLRKSVSSPAAAAVVNDVHELVSRLETTRPLGTVDPLQAHCKSSSPRQYIVHEDLVVDIRSPGPGSIALAPPCLSAASSSEHSQRATPQSGASGSPRHAWGNARTPVPDGPVYSALRQELAKSSAESASGRRSPGSPLSDSSPRAVASAGQEKRKNPSEASLEEAKTSNKLLSRALLAVQQRLKQTEAEREQLRRERDYFRQIAFRFPFTLSASSNENALGASRRFQSWDS